MSPARVLVVDDNAAARYVVGRVLRDAGHEVLETETGAGAFEGALRERPEVVLLDVHLPDISGYEICRKLKSDPRTSHIGVVQISAAFTSPKDRAAGLIGGADYYLTAPVDPEVLAATVDALLRIRRAEEAARCASAEWQATFDAVSDGLALIEEDGRIARCNAALETWFRRPAVGRLAGMPCEEALGAAAAALIAKARASGWREARDIDMGLRVLAFSADPLPGGRVVCLVSDVSEDRRRRRSELEKQKRESVGVLAAGVAHDFNNLLTGIMGNASLALFELDHGHPAAGKIEEVVKSSERAAAVVRQLLAYAGKGHYAAAPLDLSAVIRENEELLRAALPRRILLRFELADRLPQLLADRTRMQQILVNLITNAGEAIDGHGQVTVRTRPGIGRRVVLEVEDTGSGMDPDTQAQIFDPFFSTKFLGRGMGLAAVAGIVHSHRGEIDVESEPGAGSLFRLSFPEHEADPASRPLVLLVDDEPVVLRLAETALRAFGYQVVTARNGRDAVNRFEASPDQVALVLLDLAMPQVGGHEALRRIRDLRPDVPVLVSTGLSEQEAMARLAMAGNVSYLYKPYTTSQLRAAVAAVLGREAPAAGSSFST